MKRRFYGKHIMQTVVKKTKNAIFVIRIVREITRYNLHPIVVTYSRRYNHSVKYLGVPSVFLTLLTSNHCLPHHTGTMIEVLFILFI
jgi:hypothetical protein